MNLRKAKKIFGGPLLFGPGWLDERWTNAQARRSWRMRRRLLSHRGRKRSAAGYSLLREVFGERLSG